MNDYEVAAYTYRADVYHPGCAVLEYLQRHGLEGHGLSHENEAALDLLARFAGINRDDEYSFDSDDFPKAVLGYQAEDMSENHACGRCHGSLIGYAYITRSWMRATVR